MAAFVALAIAAGLIGVGIYAMLGERHNGDLLGGIWLALGLILATATVCGMMYGATRW